MVKLTLITVPCSYHIVVGSILSEMTTNTLSTAHNECLCTETQQAGQLYTYKQYLHLPTRMQIQRARAIGCYIVPNYKELKIHYKMKVL
jgi:hypothetical protein